MVNTTATSSPTAKIDTVVLTLTCLLLFIWPIPKTIALRIAALIALLLLLAYIVHNRSLSISEAVKQNKLLIGTYAVLTLWLPLQAILFSTYTIVSLYEFWGQWIRASFFGLTGYLVATIAVANSKYERQGLLATILTLTLAFQVGLHDIDTLWRWWDEGTLPFQETRITANRAGLSLVTNLLMGFIAAEGMIRLTCKKRYLLLSSSWLLIITVGCFFATYVLGTRFGTLGILSLCISCAFLAFLAKRKTIGVLRLVISATALSIALVTFAWSTIKSDQRWESFTATVPVALDIDRHPEWRNSELGMPLLDNGKKAEESAYLRIAWTTAALRAIESNPLGVGFGRNAFGNAMLLVYPDYASSKHCHSGILNFTVGAGIPGLILWLTFISLLIIKGWRSFFLGNSANGLILLFLVTGYFSRSIVDGNFQDHTFEQFMFLAMLFSVLTNNDLKSTGEL